jgi:hypothetical protein
MYRPELVNPSTPWPEDLGLPFDKPKAPSKFEGLRVDPELGFLPGLQKLGIDAELVNA